MSSPCREEPVDLTGNEAIFASWLVGGFDADPLPDRAGVAAWIDVESSCRDREDDAACRSRGSGLIGLKVRDPGWDSG